LKALKEAFLRASPQVDAELSVWIDAQRLKIIEALKKPTKDDCGMLIEIIQEHGNISILCETYVPHFMEDWTNADV
jgi:hypothetical protein